MTIKEKALLREQYIAARGAIPKAKRAEKSRQIIARIEADPIFIRARAVAIYHPIRTEVDLLGLLNHPDKRFCLPKITDLSRSQMRFVWYSGQYEDGPFGIREPIGDYALPHEIDLILVPGLAFDRCGYRLGYGKGFYDNYLSLYPNSKYGIGFEEQLADNLPHMEHDVKLDVIITDKEALCIRH